MLILSSICVFRENLRVLKRKIVFTRDRGKNRGQMEPERAKRKRAGRSRTDFWHGATVPLQHGRAAVAGATHGLTHGRASGRAWWHGRATGGARPCHPPAARFVFLRPFLFQFSGLFGGPLLNLLQSVFRIELELGLG